MATSLVAVLLVGQHVIQPDGVPTVDAICFGGWSACAGSDLTRTSTMTVTHITTGGVPVVPNTTEVWTATAVYSDAGLPGPGCTADTPFAATLTVTNNGNGYNIVCNPCPAVFTQAEICSGTICASGTESEYVIKLDMLQTLASAKQLRTVTYQSTSIANGLTIDASCNTGSAVSPTSQSWSATDTTLPCAYDCTSDTRVTITY